VDAVNDTLVDKTKAILIKMRGNADYTGTEVMVYSTNVTVPKLTARLNPIAFAEDSTTGSLLSISHNLEDTSVAVPLTIQSDDARLIVPANLEIAVGTREVNVRVMTTADPNVQGTVAAQVTVDDNAFTTDFAPATATAILYDRQAVLTAVASPALISESGSQDSYAGNPNSTVIRVTRNGSTALPLSVKLTFRAGEGQVTFAPTHTIPAGESYVDVVVTAVADEVAEGSIPVKITATAAGYISSIARLIVVD
jgi:hypothetical protein